jgi:hypothetical protein
MSGQNADRLVNDIVAGQVASGAIRMHALTLRYRGKQARVFAIAALLLVASSQRAWAQTDTSRHTWIFRTPSFVLQPGAVTSNFIDTPAGTTASTAFNLRVVTAIPTTVQRTTLVGIVQWTPRHDVAAVNENAPSFVFGPVFRLGSVRIVSLDFDVLDSYGPAARSTDDAAYTHKLVLEADVALTVGALMTHEAESRWRSVALYGFLANVATGLPSGSSRWVLLSGLSVPIAP